MLAVDRVRFGFQPDRPVVRDCSAQLQAGKVTALIGPNAAGKTTLMRLMLGLLKPDAGMVTLAGEPVSEISARRRAARVSYVPQRPSVRFAFTVGEVIAMGSYPQGLTTKAQHSADAMLERCGLASLSKRVFAELSGGQQQRVLLARARLQSEADGLAMLLDEPGSHLDLRFRHAMMDELVQLAESGLAVLIVLHDLDLAVGYADQVWLMDQGELVAKGDWQDVLTPTTLEPVYGLSLRLIESGARRPILAVDAQHGAMMNQSNDKEA